MVQYKYNFDLQYHKIYAELARQIMVRGEKYFAENITEEMISKAAAAAELEEEEEEEEEEEDNKKNDDDNNDEKDDAEDDVEDHLYSFKELQYICLKVYQQELLLVCGLEQTDSISKIGKKLDEVWDKIYTKPGGSERFKLLIMMHQDTYFKELKNTEGIHRSYFAIMFDFDTFHIIHRCLGEFFNQDGNVSKELLDELDAELKNQKNNK